VRISTLLKNVFNDDMTPTVKIVTKEELDKKIKTKSVLIDTEVVIKLFKFFVSRGNVEGAGLLRGQMCGEYLLIKDVYLCKNAKGTSTSAIADTPSFSEVSKIKDGNQVVGLAHSHVGTIPVFMSGTDKTTQKDFQAMFSDSISMVMNPFTPDGICFRFYRFEDDSIKQVPHGFLRCKNESKIQA
jgi:hypothetical protein